MDTFDVEDTRRDHIRYLNELWGGHYCRLDHQRWPCRMTLALDEIERLSAALDTINGIRDRAIRTQRASWATVMYPLVKALNEAGVASTVTDEELALAPIGNRLDGAVVTD